MTQELVLQWLREVQHPGREDKDIVSLGMVSGVEITEGKIINWLILKIGSYTFMIYLLHELVNLPQRPRRNGGGSKNHRERTC